MKDPWDIGYRFDENFITILELALQIRYQASKILLLRPIIKREDHDIGCNKKDDKE